MGRKQKVYAFAAIMVVAIVVVLFAFAIYTHQNGFPIPLPHSYQLSTLQSLLTAPTPLPALVGGTPTSLSQIQVYSNIANISGQAWLTTFVINGKGQSYNGTIQNTAQAINKSYSSQTPTQQVSITYALNSEKLQIPYNNGGTGIYQWVADNLSLGYSISCPFGIFCSQSNSGPYYTLAEAQINANPPLSTLVQAMNGFGSLCVQQGLGATPLLVAYYTPNPSPLPSSQAAAVELECARPREVFYGTVYTPSVASILLNASVTFSNQSWTHTLYLTQTQQSAKFNNILYAQIAGYEGTGYSIPTESAPSALVLANGKTNVVPSYPIASVISTQYGSFQAAGACTPVYSIGTYSVSGFCTQQSIVNFINSTNTDLNDVTVPLQSTDFYAPMKLNTSTGTTIGTLDISSTPFYYPEVQLLAKVTTLAVFVPVAKPTIKSIYPNPVYIRSGSANFITVNIGNNATVAASVSVKAICAGISTVFPAQNPLNIAPGGIGQAQINIGSLYNPNLANEQLNCEVNASSTSYGFYSSVAPFTVLLQPNCPIGTAYYNNTNCQSISPQGNLTKGTNTCTAGYVSNSTTKFCQPSGTCPSGYTVSIHNATLNCIPPAPAPDYVLWIILGIVIAAIVAVIALILYLKFGKKKGIKTRAKT